MRDTGHSHKWGSLSKDTAVFRGTEAAPRRSGAQMIPPGGRAAHSAESFFGLYYLTYYIYTFTKLRFFNSAALSRLPDGVLRLILYFIPLARG